jgi:hypothetical protein
MPDAAPHEKVVSQVVGILPELQDLYGRAISGRESLDRLRQSRLAITNLNGSMIHSPSFFSSALTP